MIFTVGHTESYEQGLREEPELKKLGKRDDWNGRPYGGGSVWLTADEAQQQCPDGYSVYGVIADWDRDAEQLPNEPFRRLLVDSVIVPANASKPE